MRSQYTKPIIKTYFLDKDISLMMQTSEVGLPEHPQQTTPPTSQQSELQSNPFDENNLN